MRFAMLASGSKGNSFVLMDQDVAIMIDCGTCKTYILNCLEKLNLKPSDLNAVLITHDHSDHIAALKAVANRPIFAPVALQDYPSYQVIQDQPFKIAHLDIYPLCLSHDALNTTGYVIQNEHEKLVYITDTGYIKQEYYPILKGADYYIVESNHDVEMLMNTSRPYYLKQRILGDEGHLNNQDCARFLDEVVSENTKSIILAHQSEQANTSQLALNTTLNQLAHHEGKLRHDLWVSVAKPRKIIKGGVLDNEEMDLDSDCVFVCMESLSHGSYSI